ncbi:hypothetical protein [Roseateles sp. L2-2]|uniref:hypothetical protein n=1 Tax=Roseateles sp. L2-2 TaxID=3422597 RepID=UPI003D35A965
MTDFATRGKIALATHDARALRATAGAQAAFLAPGLAQFYVVPWALRTVRDGDVETTLVECRYFDAQWHRVDGPPLRGDYGFCRLTQCATTWLGESPPEALDLTLMSAVARTTKPAKALSALGSLGNSFIASGAPRATSLIVPVLPDTTRGMVLVFRSPAAGDKVTALIATEEPQISRGKF